MSVSAWVSGSCNNVGIGGFPDAIDFRRRLRGSGGKPSTVAIVVYEAYSAASKFGGSLKKLCAKFYAILRKLNLVLVSMRSFASLRCFSNL